MTWTALLPTITAAFLASLVEVVDLMRRAGRPQGKEVIFPGTDIWDRLREAVARKEVEREEFRSWVHFTCAMVLSEDTMSVIQLEQLITKRLND